MQAQTNTTTMVLSFHEDYGHGWLAVPKTLLGKLGIADQISPYSFERGGVAYLEEDCDASLFMQAARAWGITIKLNEIHHKDDAPCRSFRGYSAPAKPSAIPRDAFAGLFAYADGVSND